VETTPAKLDQAALTELDAAFAGELVLPDGADFDRHRAVWNGSIDRRPVLIARCAGKDDVAAVLTLARRTGLPLAVRGGGHSFPGQSVCDDGIVADLGPMKRVEVDPEAGTVRAQGGILLGELDRATQEHGLAVPAGIVTHTGLAGLTLGGGIGWLQRKHGLTIDQLLSVEVVTAEGEVVRASEEENADLFWGIRGGGGNFGVVTDFEFRLSAVGPLVLAGPIFWLMEDSPRLLRFYREWVADRPSPQGAGSFVRTDGAARRAGRGRDLLLRRVGRGRGTGDRAVEGIRIAGSRPLRAEALRRPPEHVRPLFPARPLVLHALLRRGRALRRGDRHHG
jgi:hypothetical protein